MRIKQHWIRYIAFYLENLVATVFALSVFLYGWNGGSRMIMSAALLILLLLYLVDVFYRSLLKRSYAELLDDKIVVYKATAWGQNINDIELHSIRDVSVFRGGLLESMLNYGTVIFHLGGSVAISLHYISEPDDVAKSILAKVESSR